MRKISNLDFISEISNNKNSYITFLSQKSDNKKIIKLLETIEENNETNIMYFLIDETSSNTRLSEEVEIPDTPCIICFRDGSFVRYKNKELNLKNVKKFLGIKNKKEKI